jgi:transcriptional regulator with XRE-family HTH domain
MKHMRDTRVRLGLTLGDLQQATGIDLTTLSRYETGKREPSVARAGMVARALGVSLDFLVGSHDEEPATELQPCVLPANTNTKAPLASSARESASGAR